MTHSIWQHPFWNSLGEMSTAYVTEVPEQVDLELWQGKDIFFVHSSSRWDLYTLTEWSEIYERHGLSATASRQSLLNYLLKSFPVYQDHPPSKRFAKSLWLAIWSGTPTLWLHPRWKEVHLELQKIVLEFIENKDQLPIQWIVCNQTHPSSVSWQQLIYEN